jgi:hypothetical protein
MFQVAIAPSPLVSRVISAPSPASAAVTAPSSPALSSGSASTASLAAGQQKVQIVKTADGKIQVSALPWQSKKKSFMFVYKSYLYLT